MGERPSRRVGTREFFDAVARRYDRDYALSGPTSRERLGRVVAALGGARSLLVLGIGTGRELPVLLDAGHEVVGLDLSPGMIAECNKRARTVPVVVADFWAPLPFEDGAFDAVAALHGTLAHPPGDDLATAVRALGRELARVLSESGRVVIEAPAAEALPRIADGGDMTLEGPARFVHTDEALGLSVAGVALTEEGWRDALAPCFDVEVRPLGDVEHFVVARRRPERAC